MPVLVVEPGIAIGVQVWIRGYQNGPIIALPALIVTGRQLQGLPMMVLPGVHPPNVLAELTVNPIK